MRSSKKSTPTRSKVRVSLFYSVTFGFHFLCPYLAYSKMSPKTYSKIITRLGFYLEKRLSKLFSESSTVEMQLPCCPGKQGGLSEN